jgi:glyoxylate/hydroxypyruvate reductase
MTDAPVGQGDPQTMIRIHFASTAEDWAEFAGPLRQAFRADGLNVDLARDHDPALVDYVVFAPKGVLTDFRPFVRTKAVLSLWAGVEKITHDTTLTQPLCRMVDRSLEEGMVQYVAGHVLRYHLGLDHWLARPGGWTQVIPPLAADRPVTVLGLGELGRACARALTRLGFPVTGWSASPKTIPGITVLDGRPGLPAALASAQILVLMLPLTPATENLIDAAALAALPRGAVLINPARGGLIDDAALLAALDSGHLAHATLDVFRTEPLPDDHPFRTHPAVTVTPHIAAQTLPETASAVISANVRRGEAGAPFLYLVDRSRGY